MWSKLTEMVLPQQKKTDHKICSKNQTQSPASKSFNRLAKKRTRFFYRVRLFSGMLNSKCQSLSIEIQVFPEIYMQLPEISSFAALNHKKNRCWGTQTDLYGLLRTTYRHKRKQLALYSLLCRTGGLFRHLYAANLRQPQFCNFVFKYKNNIFCCNFNIMYQFFSPTGSNQSRKNRVRKKAVSHNPQNMKS